MTTDGGSCPVAVDAVQPLDLALHELMSNAVRHGALARPEGSVCVECEDTSAGLRLTWTEAGGGAVDGSPVKGIGFRILEGIIERQLLGSVNLRWTETCARGPAGSLYR